MPLKAVPMGMEALNDALSVEPLRAPSSWPHWQKGFVGRNRVDSVFTPYPDEPCAPLTAFKINGKVCKTKRAVSGGSLPKEP